MKLNDVFSIEEYDEAYAYIKENPEYTIRENETSDGERQFQIVEIPQPSQEKLNAQEVAQLKQYLMSTDYVIIKLAESTDESEKQEMLAKYDEIIIKRKEARQKINKLEK